VRTVDAPFKGLRGKSTLRTAALGMAALLLWSCGSGGAGPAQVNALPAQALASPVLDEGGGESPEPKPLATIPEGSFKVPILMYHYVRENPDPNDKLGASLSVSPAHFQEQMDWLRDNGYQPITFSELGSLFSRQRQPARHPVILTFDDGYADFFQTALPILQGHGFAAVAYIVSGFLGRPGYMTADQVVQASRSGIEIGSHTVGHVDLTRASPAQLQQEVTGSRSQLERLLKRKVLDFCYPGGRFNNTVIRAVQAAGYRDATTTQPGSLHSSADRYTWTRVRVSGGEELADFVRAIAA
jgi:peptidoglycan/xylan/chitin deacetylase (PgdA/CDA1 family)